jgi:zinc/manganese transport system ATP-binding protein
MSPPVEPGSTTSAMSFRDAAVRLRGRTIWSGVSLDVPRGEFVAVVGPNGAGKSTLIKATLGIHQLSHGDATVLGLPPGQAGKRIGYLPQRRSFDASLRIRGIDVVRLGLDGNRWGMPLPWADRLHPARRGEHERVAEVLELVGATPYATRAIGQTSGGEQQRLLIAQALVHDPELLLLDEPLDSLDLPNQAAIAGVLSRICRDRGITVLIVAHDVNPILNYLDRVVYLAGGHALSGSPSEVITSETLSRLYGTPIEVLHTSDGGLVVVGHPEAPAYHSDRHTGRAHERP